MDMLPQQETQQEKEKVDLLLVDDRPENLMALEAILAGPSYQILTANSGDKALRLLLDYHPALILMDVQMPTLSGFETASIIRRSEKYRYIPIIFITASHRDENFIYEGYGRGAIDYIPKPIDPFILRSKVSIFVELYRKNQQILRQERLLRLNEQKEKERLLTLVELQNLRQEHLVQQRFLDLVEGINHGVVWAADFKNFSITFIGPSSERILGMAQHEWSQHAGQWPQYVHPEDRPLFLQSLEEIRRDGKERQIEHRFVRPDSSIIWLQTGIRLVDKMNGHEQEWRGLSVDITSSKKIQEIQRRNKEHSDFLAEVGHLINQSFEHEKGLQQVIHLSVPRFFDWFGLEIYEEPHLGIGQLFYGSADDSCLIQLHRQLCRHFLQSQEQGRPLLLKKSPFPAGGTATSFNSAMILPLNIRNKTIGILTLALLEGGRYFDELDFNVAKELTSRISNALDNALLFNKAQAAIKARDEFISIASHELRTPLTSLKLHTQMIERTLKKTGQVSREKWERTLKITDRQLDRLATLVDQLLDISQINHGRLGLKLEEFDLAVLVQDVVDRFHNQLFTNTYTLGIDRTTSLLGRWDRFRIEQVITNLLSNAVKYGEGKPISIQVYRENDVAKFLVQDQGIGVDPKHQEQIFHRFERVAPTDRNISGLGLGLYIVAQIVHHHQGRIKIESEKGRGSTFIVELPLSS